MEVVQKKPRRLSLLYFHSLVGSFQDGEDLNNLTHGNGMQHSGLTDEVDL